MEFRKTQSTKFNYNLKIISNELSINDRGNIQHSGNTY